MELTLLEIIELVFIGLAAGTLGGMLGIGGSVIMIPAMAIIFREFNQREWFNQHLAQAAAMWVNLAIAIPSARTHWKNDNVPKDLFVYLFPAALISIIGGVLLSDLLPGNVLAQLFAVFLLYVVLTNALKIVRRAPDHAVEDRRVTPLRGTACGIVMGGFAGLLGIGGGAIAVPLMHVVCRVPLKRAIGASAAVMCLTAGVGASVKLATVGDHASPLYVIVLALVLAPSAILGSRIGASLTHRVPLNAVRIVFTIVLFLAALKLGGIA